MQKSKGKILVFFGKMKAEAGAAVCGGALEAG